jgi:hypothetical protein
MPQYHTREETRQTHNRMTKQPKENKKQWDMGKTGSDNMEYRASGRINSVKRMKEGKQERKKARNGCLED